MKDIDQIRRDNMLLLEKKFGGPTAAALRLDWDQPQWSNLRSGAPDSRTGKPRGMRKSTARKIEAAFGYPPFWLDVDHSTEIGAQLVERAQTMYPVKVIGVARLCDDGYFDEIECDGLIDCYNNDPDIYGLRIKGDDLHPAIRHGSIIVVSPHEPLVPTEYVIVVLNGGRKMLKELIVERSEEVVVESPCGAHRQTIGRENVVQIYPVVAVVSPSKLRLI